MTTVTAPTAPPKSLILTPRHLALLEAAWRYRLLTAGDVQRLLQLKSRSHVGKLLGDLCGGADDDDAERAAPVLQSTITTSDIATV